MRLGKQQSILVAMVMLAGCSFGPRVQTALPQVRDVPVLAGLSPAESMARGRTFLASKQYGLAIELFKTSSRDPALAADSFNGLAVAYDGIGRRDIAERYFQRALAARPDDQRTKRNLAAFYANSGQEEKRRQLLAGAPAAPLASVTITERMAPEGLQKRDLVPASLPPVDFAVAPALQARSPLGGTLRPLLAGAILSSSTVQASASGEVSILCSREGGALGGDGAMTIFRISMGEVFIAPQPAGSTCVVEGDTVSPSLTLAEHPLSNKEYLGLVASYLDRINALQTAGDISIAWKTAFWSQDDRA